jgi:hypothetical protein
MRENLAILGELERAGRRFASWFWINVGIAALGGVLTAASYNATAPGDRYIVFKGAIGWGLIFAVVNAAKYFRVQYKAAHIRAAVMQGLPRPAKAKLATPAPAAVTTSGETAPRKTAPNPGADAGQKFAGDRREYFVEYFCADMAARLGSCSPNMRTEIEEIVDEVLANVRANGLVRLDRPLGKAVQDPSAHGEDIQSLEFGARVRKDCKFQWWYDGVTPGEIRKYWDHGIISHLCYETLDRLAINAAGMARHEHRNSIRR